MDLSVNMVVISGFLFLIIPYASALDFLINSFASSDVLLINDARVESSVIRLTNDSDLSSYGRAFYPSRIPMFKPNSSVFSSFSTSFVFSIMPETIKSLGYGFVFALCNSTSPPGAESGRYFGLFSDTPSVYPVLGVKFDVARNADFNDPDANNIGINLNNIESIVTQTAGYYDSVTAEFVPVQMRTGRNIRAWIEFHGTDLQINVTIAPVGMSKPIRPSLSFKSQDMANYLSTEMYVGFSASKKTSVEAQRVLAWSFSDAGDLQDINVTDLPDFSSASSILSRGAVVGVAAASFALLASVLAAGYWLWLMRCRRAEFPWRKYASEEDADAENWELEYWPHRFSHPELSQATKGFSNDVLLGSGGFGKVYRGILRDNKEVAVKCINHDSNQGPREFMAEIGSIGRLQHKNLVQMRGWCRKGNEFMLVYNYMPNGSLDRWIFNGAESALSWSTRRRVLSDVAEGLNYLHNCWDQVVIHRDIKSSNILLDVEMRGRLGDFGLAKLHLHGSVPNATRLVGTLGYLAPELYSASPTTASDVYSFGIVVLEVVCGRRPIDMKVTHEEQILIEWVRHLYVEGRLFEAADERIKGEYQIEEMESILKLGLACCHPDPAKRPTTKEVAEFLINSELLPVASTSPSHGLTSSDNRNTSTSCSENSVEAKLPSWSLLDCHENLGASVIFQFLKAWMSLDCPFSDIDVRLPGYSFGKLLEQQSWPSLYWL